MNSKSKTYVLVIVLLIIVAVIMDSGMPKKTDWREYYRIDKTEPFDLKILYSEIQKIKSWHSINTIDSTYYQYSAAEFEDSAPNDFLLVYIGNIFSLDQESEKLLLKHIELGNDAFISTNDFGSRTFDTFGLAFNISYFYKQTDIRLWLNGSDESITINKLSNVSHIFASKRTEPYYSLGQLSIDNSNEAFSNFVKIPYGKGNIYLHSNPVIFSNYYLINGSQSMTERILSVSDRNHLLLLTEPNISSTDKHLLKFIFSHNALRWAWYVSLGSLMIFIIFNAKRRQRIVPVIEPLENTTVGFTKTISNLFYETKDHNYVVQKRITYFLEYIRNRYHLDTGDLSSRFIQDLSMKSGVDKSSIELLIQEIIIIKEEQQLISESQVIHLDRLLERFKTEEQSITQK